MNTAPDTRHLIGAPPRLSSQAMAFVLAGGRGSRLEELTDRRAKPAVHFGGKSRIIDFPLSNALNSGVRKMAVATQYKAHSLIRHMRRGWGFFRAERNEYLDILPASQRVQENKWYLGTADAVTQNIDIVDDYDIEYVIILAGDHVYKMDYEIMLRQHVNTQADVTIGPPDRSARRSHRLWRHARERERPHRRLPGKAGGSSRDA
ncbi:sugar phosphate nucleotidyltransferase [Glutamicibacter halophytocola]|uniref:sugar phosphate nucleotidyltransferase n=1 Tax=Glutamicibacter halophytocola TaxID=1933880 RepID=UPI003219A40A